MILVIFFLTHPGHLDLGAQGVGGLAGDDVDFIPVGDRRKQVAVAHTDAVQGGRIDTTAHHQAAIQVLRHGVGRFLVLFHQDHVVFPATDGPGQIEAHRPGTYNDDLQFTSPEKEFNTPNTRCTSAVLVFRLGMNRTRPGPKPTASTPFSLR